MAKKTQLSPTATPGQIYLFAAKDEYVDVLAVGLCDAGFAIKAPAIGTSLRGPGIDMAANVPEIAFEMEA